MILKKVYVNFTIRLVLLTTNIFLLVYGLLKEIEFFTIINLGILLIIQLFLLIRKFNLLNRELLVFFESIKSDESGLMFQKKTGNKDLDELYSKFDEINHKISKVKAESIKSNQHFQNLVEHVNTGIIQYDEKGNIDVINKVAKDFFQCGDIHNLSNLDQKIPSISISLLKLELGSSKSIKVLINGVSAILNFKVTEFKIDGKPKKLVSFQNIKNELELNETDSWKKLIRVLTHEIMNSSAPISSSIKVISNLLKDRNSGQIKNINEITDKDIAHTVRGLEIIEERSDGLNQFIKSYRELTKSIEPFFTEFQIIEIFRSVEFLFAEDFKYSIIDFEHFTQPENLVLKADKNLVEQVLINLVKNSIDAVKDQIKKEIRLEAHCLDNEIIIKIIDSGAGVSPDESDKIFTPFFSTKQEGSGIGLSLSRQIMQLHNGEIYFESAPKRGTIFHLKFSKMISL